jgi:hypothetical protein
MGRPDSCRVAMTVVHGVTQVGFVVVSTIFRAKFNKAALALLRVSNQNLAGGVYSMRLWSLHPKYLDPQGLVALWREALLARAVLRGETRGYTRHPQLERFKAHPHPRRAINAYLAAVQDEATRRGYAFDRSRIGAVREVVAIPVNSGQLACEWSHLARKLTVRNPAVLARWSGLSMPACHPLFRRRVGPVASWERASNGG